MKLADLIVDVCEVYTTSLDNTKGELVGVFSSYEKAYNAAKGKGQHGMSGLIFNSKGIILKDTVFVLKYNPVDIDIDITSIKEKEIDDILSKLSPEDIEKLKINRANLKEQKSSIESSFFPLNIPA